MGFWDKKSTAGTATRKMQNISIGANSPAMKDSAQSVPTSPVTKSSSVTTTGPASHQTTPPPVPTSAGSRTAKFFTFRWLFRGSKGSSSAKKLRLKQMNDKTKEKLASIGSNTSKILLRQSYSFDDIQQFLLSQQSASNTGATGGDNHSAAIYRQHMPHHHKSDSHSDRDGGQGSSHHKNKILCKSSLEIGRKKSWSAATGKCVQRFKCKLCLTKSSGYQMHSIWSCGCAFCKPCLSQYCEMSIREGKVALIACPDGSCPEHDTKANVISAREIQLLVAKDMYEAYKRYRLNWMIERDPTRTWCPTPNCETVCHIKPPKQHKDSKKPIPVHCSTCNKTFCSSCRRGWHLGVDCKKFNAHEDVLLNESSSPIKRCPKCCILIERDEGCAQIMCRNCKHVFCWYCLASLEDDFLLRHYDKGQCKDKLGHSRASVIWHRTQVVGIFAGFGLLILLASPMFILAAPCLLCCRCNSWYKSDADHDPVSGEDFDPAISSSDIGVKSDSIL